MPGYSAPIVKTEVPEAEEEVADYGAPEEETKAEGAPQRSMPDYGDLLDDDEPTLVQGGVKESKEEDGVGATPRPDSIHMTGVQRLTRTHLDEIFRSKKLPSFRWVEWMDDDQVVCVFEKAADAAAALKGCEAGFHDLGESQPGPGLWRAQRCMLDFRVSTQADRPSADFKRQHRGGRQVREFRFWEAMKDMDQNILGGEATQGMKRALPSGEDTMAAADWDDDAQRRKRLRKGARPGEEEEDIDLLTSMAAQDKAILTKEEAGESTSLPTTNANPLVNVKSEEDGWPRRPGGSEEDSRDTWQHDDRGGSWSGENSKWWGSGDAESWGGDGWSWTPRKRRQEGQQGGGGQRRDADGDAARSRGPRNEDFALPMDDAEQAKRSRRADRFKTAAAAAASQEAATLAPAPAMSPKEEA